MNGYGVNVGVAVEHSRNEDTVTVLDPTFMDRRDALRKVEEDQIYPLS
jgi:hypothetical protein